MSDITKAVIARYNAVYIEEACNFLSAMSEAELDDAGPEYQRLFGYALAIRGALRQMEAALEQSVEVIKTWHNMDGSDHVWDIYYRNAPEMKAIREALTP